MTTNEQTFSHTASAQGKTFAEMRAIVEEISILLRSEAARLVAEKLCTEGSVSYSLFTDVSHNCVELTVTVRLIDHGCPAIGN